MKFPENYPAVLPVMEQFYTIQGEGAYTGNAAYFIRLAGCDVGCVWCDVKESWDVSAQQWIPVEDIVAEAAKYPGKTIVITGGEPLMYDLSLLTEKLHEAGIRIHIETSGAYPLSGSIDWICLSPKKFKAPLTSVCNVAHELKVIIFNKSDFDWAEKYAALVQHDCQLFIQPEWEKRATVEPLMIDYVKNNPRWRMSVQTHKYLDIP